MDHTNAIDKFRAMLGGQSIHQFVGRLQNVRRFHPKENIRQFAEQTIQRLLNGAGYDDLTEADYRLFELCNKLHTLRVVADDSKKTA